MMLAEEAAADDEEENFLTVANLAEYTDT